ncbi:MAG: AAA family ATPase, partial [Nitrosopumilaceae archaeon]|nr:AAA family ATPase [Nitrosopumilaceae archaeon]
LQKFDIANMTIAEKTKSPVVLITDIDRGGSFASLVGTLSLLEKKHQKLVQGFVFNKFLGDVEILKPGFTKLKRLTKKEVFGVIPKIKINIPDEDSLDSKPKTFLWNKRNLSVIDREIDKLSKLVQKNINIKALEKIIG